MKWNIVVETRANLIDLVMVNFGIDKDWPFELDTSMYLMPLVVIIVDNWFRIHLVAKGDDLKTLVHADRFDIRCHLPRPYPRPRLCPQPILVIPPVVWEFVLGWGWNVYCWPLIKSLFLTSLTSFFFIFQASFASGYSNLRLCSLSFGNSSLTPTEFQINVFGARRRTNSLSL